MGPRKRRDLQPYAFVLPLMALEIAFVAVPLCLGFYYSLHRADFFQITEFRGLGNYERVLMSPMVLNSLWVTSIFSFFALIFTFALGFALALHLERDTRLNVFLRAVVLIPYVIAMLVGSLLLKWIFTQDSGLLHLALGPLGMGQATILADPQAAMAALVFNAVWRDSAFAMILLLAGLKSIDPQLYAAARVDGASAWMRFRTLTLPLMRIPILITTIRLLIHFVNVLTFALVLTSGGPNEATQTIGLTMYRIGFIDFRIGQASAMSILVFLFNLALIAVLLRLFREKQGAA
jgi:ABC-type sugar transport system permease subunit